MDTEEINKELIDITKQAIENSKEANRVSNITIRMVAIAFATAITLICGLATYFYFNQEATVTAESYSSSYSSSDEGSN